MSTLATIDFAVPGEEVTYSERRIPRFPRPGGRGRCGQPGGDITRSYELHANAYIVKPADPGRFDDVIKAIATCFLSLIEPPPPA